MKLTLTVILVLAVAVFASDPRLFVITGDARLMDDDYTEIWAYPGTMVNYEFATINSVESGDGWAPGWGGIVMNSGGTTWGITHNHDGKLIEGLYHTGDFGIIVGFDYDKYEYTPEGGVTVTQSSGLGFDAALGTEFDLFGDYSDFAIGGFYESTNAFDTLKTTDIGLGASLRGHGPGFFNLFPIISTGFSSDKTEITSGDDTYDYTETTIVFDIGAGKNFMFAPKTHIVAGVFAGLQNVSYSVSEGDAPDSDMYIDLPFFKVGVEQYIGKWLVARVGGQYRTTIGSYTNPPTGNDISSVNTYYTTNFGIGLYWDNFMLDAVISDDFVHDGPYMIGGHGNGFMGNIAAVYNF